MPTPFLLAAAHALSFDCGSPLQLEPEALLGRLGPERIACLTLLERSPGDPSLALRLAEERAKDDTPDGWTAVLRWAEVARAHADLWGTERDARLLRVARAEASACAALVPAPDMCSTNGSARGDDPPRATITLARSDAALTAGDRHATLTVLRARHRSLAGCASPPWREGRLELRVTLRTGEPPEVARTADTTGDDAVFACASGRLASWPWPGDAVGTVEAAILVVAPRQGPPR